MAQPIEILRSFEIPGRITVLEGNGELPKIEVTTRDSIAEIYLHGAHVTGFQLRGQAPLLFMSQCSRFASGQPIRGGIPIILPWFGPREGEAAHGFARVTSWELVETNALPEGGATLRFHLPETAAAAMWPRFSASYTVTVTERLSVELVVTNLSRDGTFDFEDCLHSYFQVGAIEQVSVLGLKGVTYLDKVENYARKVEAEEGIVIGAEVDRVYLDTTGAVEILDHGLGRSIRIEKWGSQSTVVWNPWVAKAAQMPDFGDEEYERMVCVESGNIGPNKITLAPGCSTSLRVFLSSAKL